MKRLTLVLFLILSTKAFAEEKKITANDLKNTITNMPEKISNFGKEEWEKTKKFQLESCLLYTSPSPRDPKTSRMPSSA